MFIFLNISLFQYFPLTILCASDFQSSNHKTEVAEMIQEINTKY